MREFQMEQFYLSGKRAIITGGERGIGLEIAIGFAKAGADIIIAGLMEDEFTTAKMAVRAQGVNCLCTKTDVSDEASVEELAKSLQTPSGTVDILVNNAGINKQSPAESMPLSVWKNIMDVNLTGTFLMCRAFGERMLTQGHGSIINIASISGLVVNPLPQTQCAYNSSKAGVIMLTKCLANEWADRDVRVNAICPGFTHTPLTAKRLNMPNDPIVNKWLGGTPMGRVADPSEMVGLAVYFASDASSFTTGAVMAVDGGYTC